MNTSTELVEVQVPLYLKNITMITCYFDTCICEAALSQPAIKHLLFYSRVLGKDHGSA